MRQPLAGDLLRDVLAYSVLDVATGPHVTTKAVVGTLNIVTQHGSIPALLTDRYELTMVDAALATGTARTRCVFEVFTRRLPVGRRYGVFAGLDRLISLIQSVRFDDDTLRWLVDEGVIRKATAAWLGNFRFQGTMTGYAEGEVFFPGSPVLTVEGSFAECVLLETLTLSVLNYDSAVASAAARMVCAARGREMVEMGSRRAHEQAAVAAARAAYLAGFDGTSNLMAGKTFEIPTFGTSAHAFTLLHDAENEAFASQLHAQGAGTTLLVDTYDTTHGVDRAVAAAGPRLGAVRIDSGDLADEALTVRAQLDSLGAHDTKIVVTGDLDELSIADLADAPVDRYGVGTSVVTGSGAPTTGFVYKLAAKVDANGQWQPVAKASAQKATIGGRKHACRIIDGDGVARAERVTVGHTEECAEGRTLMMTHVPDGDFSHRPCPADALQQARERCAASLRELPETALALHAGLPAVPTEMVESSTATTTA